MQDINLTTGPIWSFNDNSSDNAIKLSLPEVLYSDMSLSHYPTPGYLAPIQHELLASILQVAIDTVWPKGIPEKLHSELTKSDQLIPVRSTINKICEQLKKQEGFNLIGNGAFLQMPTNWRSAGKESPIAGLIWPFIPNIQGEAKGNRRIPVVPTKMEPALTALYLFSTCLLSKGGSYYWNSGNLTNRTSIHQYRGKTLRQHLFQAILPGYAPSWKPIQPLPWIPHCKNNGGLESNDKPPFARYLTGKQNIRGTANIRFYQARAIILDPPEQGVCDFTGASTTVFSTYRLINDLTLHQQLKRCCKLPNSLKMAGILSKMYDKHDHPSVSTPSQQDEQKKFNELPHYGYTKPYWAISRASHQYPSDVIDSRKASSQSNNPLEKISLFQINYAKKNQDPKGIFIHQKVHTCCDSKLTAIIDFLNDTAKQTIQQIRSGLWLLLIPNNKSRLSTTSQEYLDIWLLTCRQHLWHTADTLFYAKSASKSLDDCKYQITRRFQEAKHHLWQKILADYQDVSSMCIKDHFKEYSATKIALGEDAMFIDLPYLESKPVVKAGRAFARAYYDLTKAEKAHLIQEIDRPFVCRHFWDCMRSATKQDPDAYQPMYEAILPLLQYIVPQEDGKNIGEILSLTINRSQSNRVDQLLAETNINSLLDEILITLQYVTKDGRFPIPLDAGILCNDIKQYHFDKDAVIRRWAQQYFAGLETQKEQYYV